MIFVIHICISVLIAQPDDLCYSYLYFCVDHLVGWNDRFDPIFLQNVFFICITRPQKFLGRDSVRFTPSETVFFLNPWVQLEFYKNCGSISKIAAPAFEMMMNSRVAWLKQIVISRWVICFSEIVAPFQKLWLHFKNCGSCLWNDDEQPRCFGKAK